MKVFAPVVALLLFGSIVNAQKAPESDSAGMVTGTVLDYESKPVVGVKVRAMKFIMGASTGGPPTTTTHDSGKYRMSNLSWGLYTVYVDDWDAGYPSFISSSYGLINRVELSSEHPTAELNLTLPRKAGFVSINLFDNQTGRSIPTVDVGVFRSESPTKLLFHHSGRITTLPLPPDKDILLHISADGFSEWNESTGDGKTVRVGSGQTLTLNVRLEPH